MAERHILAVYHAVHTFETYLQSKISLSPWISTLIPTFSSQTWSSSARLDPVLGFILVQSYLPPRVPWTCHIPLKMLRRLDIDFKGSHPSNSRYKCLVTIVDILGSLYCFSVPWYSYQMPWTVIHSFWDACLCSLYKKGTRIFWDLVWSGKLNWELYLGREKWFTWRRPDKLSPNVVLSYSISLCITEWSHLLERELTTKPRGCQHTALIPHLLLMNSEISWIHTKVSCYPNCSQNLRQNLFASLSKLSPHRRFILPSASFKFPVCLHPPLIPFSGSFSHSISPYCYYRAFLP